MEDTLQLVLGELLRKEISAEHLLHRTIELMTRFLDADRGTLFLVETQSDELVAIAAHLPEIPSLRISRSQGVAGHVSRSGCIVNIPFCKDDRRFWRGVDARTGYATISMLAGPLRDRSGELFGVVQFLNKKQGIFTKEDESLLVVLSEQLAGVLAETTLGRGHNFIPVLQRAAKEEGEETLSIGHRINRIVGASEAMRRLYRNILRVAPTDATLLIRGESGTGKGLVARAIHHNSPRHEGPLVHVDCTTLPDNLFENELFGHERGAYTGADKRRKGKVETATGGTLFLDEIGDLPLPLQGKLLKLVQDRKYHRVGGNEELDADIRIITATNRDLEALVEAGSFREDLYYRLRVVQLTLPPLRERGREDLHKLINHFVASAARRHRREIRSIHPQALRMLMDHHWPGNVRELENCLESAVIFSDDEITPSSIPLARIGATGEMRAISTPAQISAPVPSPEETLFAGEPSLSGLESRYIQVLLLRHQNNRSVCAKILGIGRNTLRRKIQKYGLDPLPPLEPTETS